MKTLTKKCAECGDPFTRPVYQASQMKFCSHKCEGDARAKARTKNSFALFLAKVCVLTSDECWPWLGKVRSKKYPYGKITLGRVRWYAHRLSFLLHNGYLPEDGEICHSCDNPNCVNPKHLFHDSHTGNMQDAARKGRMRRLKGEANGRHKLTENEVAEIRKLKFYRGLRARLARQFNVTSGTIDKVRRGILWSHLP